MNPLSSRVWDWILVNSSGGKDSQAMLDFIHEFVGDDEMQRARVVVVHADLGRVEWAGTRELAEAQAAHYGFRFEVVRRRQGDLLDHVETRGKWPSPKNRYCTSDHKRAPIGRLITALTQEAWERSGTDALPRKHRPVVRILNCLGMRAQESPARKKLPAFEENERASCGFREVFNWLPIHAWTTVQVWDRIRASGVPHHPAYDLGMPRLSCCFCIYAPRNALLIAGEHNRELLNEYVRIEEKTGHLFREDIPIRSIRDALDSGERADTSIDTGNWNM